MKIINMTEGRQVNRNILSLDWKPEETSLGEYEHFTMKEICEQPKVLYNQPQVTELVGLIRQADKIVLTACGSSYYACLQGYYHLSKAGKTCIPIIASEFSTISSIIDSKTLILTISQSGETADTIEAINIANTKVASILNNTHSSISRLSDACIPMNAGPEIGVAATKTYTSSVNILIRAAKEMQNQPQESKENMAKNTERAIYDNMEKAKKVAEYIQDSVFIIGKESAYYTALEGALKIKELAYVFAEGFAGGELKHGSIALIDKGTPVIVIESPGILSNAQELKARGAYIIGIGTNNNAVYDEFLQVPESTEIIPLQLIAYYLSVRKGNNPDKPRNLAKSVTVK